MQVSSNQINDSHPMSQQWAKLLFKMNNTESEYPKDKSIHKCFEEIAARHPDRIALILPSLEKRNKQDTLLTYGQLNLRSDAFSQALVRAGVKKNSFVALYMERSIEMVVALLGILKCGCAYVPLDPAYPKDQLDFMLKDTQAAVLITQSHLKSNLDNVDSKLFLMDDGWGEGQDPEKIRSDEGSQNALSLAYINYTSGSTGVPKGVKVTHRGVLRLVYGVDYTRLDKEQTLLQLAPISFDAATFEIWGALLHGARCILFPYNGIPDPKDLKYVIEGYDVGTVWLTASLFNLIIDVMPQALKGLKEILTGGEALSVEHIHKAMSALPHVQLVNGYGPTESTTFTCCYRIPPKIESDRQSIPIGRPIANTTVYILDADLKPMPFGQSGELYIGGDGLAEGYLNRADLTAKSFVANPFLPGERIYKTGDLVRYLDDGNIEFLGRVDDQVKINGFRIELGEIVHLLKNHPSVNNAVVITDTDEAGNKGIVAYVTAKGDSAVDTGALKSYLQGKLAAFSIPKNIIVLDHIPLNTNGKVDRKALAKAFVKKAAARQESAPVAKSETEKVLSSIWREILHADDVRINDNFFEIGGTSILSVKLTVRINAVLGLELPITRIYEFPTIATLAMHIDGRLPSELSTNRIQNRAAGQRTALKVKKATPEEALEPIDKIRQDGISGVAIIGMSGRFPGAADINQLWANLCAGKESISFFSDDQIDKMTDPKMLRDPAYVKARGILESADRFDAGFFGISAAEATIMDPQQRVFLELAWESLENAGYVPDRFDGLIGLFAGMNNNTYFQNLVSKRTDLIERFGEFQTMLANEKDFLTTRISYKLNLTGPSVNIFTACSTSLVAVCYAYNSLMNYQCDLALAGGISIKSPQRVGYLYQEGNIQSKDGRCRPFDASSTGTPFSDGAGIVILKRLDEAILDRDHIYAVIKGYGLNNDGINKVSFTAPSVNGQAEAIAMAQAQAGISPDSVTYIEAHGTGTALGDPIEIEALTKAFRSSTDKKNFCAIGSIKSNFGHLVHAAGVAGLIKTALALENKVIPPSINFETPNPSIDFANSPFYVNDTLRPWVSNSFPRRAGVSSFGVGGTNAHVILEEAPQEGPQRQNCDLPDIVILSAKSEDGLERSTQALHDYLTNRPSAPFQDVAFTLQNGRKYFSSRRFIVCRSNEQAINALADKKLLQKNSFTVDSEKNQVVFLFPGQGSQYPEMARALYDHWQVYRDEFNKCSQLMRPFIQLDLTEALYAQNPVHLKDGSSLSETHITQPVLFAVEYAMAKLWMSWGLAPSAMIGHSIGEFVAACLAGIFTLDEAVFLVAKRGNLLQEMPPGSMLSVRSPVDRLLKLLPNHLSLSAVNSPSLCVISGQSDKVQDFKALLENEKIAAKLLHTSHAFHSHMINPALKKFSDFFSHIKPKQPGIPIVSTATGTWLTTEQAQSVQYWSEHMRNTVQFSEAVSTILAKDNRILLEVGPGSTLTMLARQQLRNNAGNCAIASIGGKRKKENEIPDLFDTIGQLWTRGINIEWDAIFADKVRRRVPLPTYPFKRKRYWIEPQGQSRDNTDDKMRPDENIATDPEPIAIPDTEKNKEMNDSSMASKLEWTKSKVTALLEDVSGEKLSTDELDSSFFEIGFDSLLLTQVSIAIKKEFKIDVAFRQLLEDLTNIPLLAEFLAKEIDDELIPVAITSQSNPAENHNNPTSREPMETHEKVEIPIPVSMNSGVPAHDVENLFSRQLAVIEKQLEILRTQGLPVATSSTMNSSSVDETVHKTTVSAKSNTESVIDHSSEAPKQDKEKSATEGKKFIGPQLKIKKKTEGVLTEVQNKFIEKFSQKYIHKTVSSKDYTQKNRSHLADPRAVAGFSPLFKEIVYPIVVKRSNGAKLWDIDGNEYIDLLNGFGSNFFGYSAPFVVEAVQKQMEKGMEIGPQSDLAGEVAEMICEATGFDRVAFCNTGSEAVLGSLRIARTVTGKNKIAMFSGAYHGIFNEVITRGKKNFGALPASPGIPREAVQNMLVFDYDAPESLEEIEKRADELAAVIIEPVQSRAPELQPREFLHKLRAIATEHNIAYIFDEVVTGFRTCLGGAQEHFGINADIATYGKVIGGGWPIGVIAGKTNFMDALDGGHWQYGDESIPEVGVTYFAGTFVRHPPALAAAKAVLNYLNREGPQVQQGLNERCAKMVAKINTQMAILEVPIQLRHFASVMKIEFTKEVQYEELLYFLLREKGIHVWHHRPCFLTLAHTDENIEAIISAFVDSAKEMKEAQLLPVAEAGERKSMDATIASAKKPPVIGARLGKDPNGMPAWFIPDPDRPGKYIKIGGQEV